MVGLSKETSFYKETSALDLPFSNEEYEVVWMEHVQMNIPSKGKFATELARVLRQDGMVVFHKIFSDSGDDPHFPVPWADGPSGNFLVSKENFQNALKEAGLEVIQWKDVTEPSLQWFDDVTQRLADSGPPQLGLHLLMGETAQTKLGNVGKTYGRIEFVLRSLSVVSGDWIKQQNFFLGQKVLCS